MLHCTKSVIDGMCARRFGRVILARPRACELRPQIERARRSLPEMSAEGRARLAPVVQQLAHLDGDASFAFVVDRTLDALAQIVESR